MASGVPHCSKHHFLAKLLSDLLQELLDKVGFFTDAPNDAQQCTLWKPESNPCAICEVLTISGSSSHV